MRQSHTTVTNLISLELWKCDFGPGFEFHSSNQSAVKRPLEEPSSAQLKPGDLGVFQPRRAVSCVLAFKIRLDVCFGWGTQLSM